MPYIEAVEEVLSLKVIACADNSFCYFAHNFVTQSLADFSKDMFLCTVCTFVRGRGEKP